MTYELTGKVKVLQETQTFDSGFKKREIVVTVEEGNYPQDVCLEFVQDKINLLDSIEVDQEVTISFNIRGSEWKGRYFTNLRGWKINIEESNISEKPQSDDVKTAEDFDEYEDDIPF